MTQREERGGLQGPNAAADDTARGGVNNAGHVAFDGLPLCMMVNILDNSMPLFIFAFNIIITTSTRNKYCNSPWCEPISHHRVSYEF
jgi:hypothetical protein